MIDQFVKNEDYNVVKAMVHDLQMLHNNGVKDLNGVRQEMEKKFVDVRINMNTKADITKLKEI